MKLACQLRLPLRLLSAAIVLAGPLGNWAQTPASGAKPAAPASARPADWALKLNRPGLENLHQVTTNLYRGAQPTAAGMEQLKALGIRTVVNLRALHSDKDELAGTGLKGERFTTNPWHSDEEDVVRFLKIVSDTNNLPVFIHCQRGADRTGLMCAMYRVVICGWTKDEAIREMTQGGFGFNPLWQNLTAWVKHADIADLKRQAGLTSALEPTKPTRK